MNDSVKMALTAVKALEEKKGSEVTVIDIEKISTIADYFIIAGGSNRNQIQALMDEVEEKLGREGYEPKHVEGRNTSGWVLMDYGDIVIHIFDEENRLFYDLERIWCDGEKVTASDLESRA